MVTVRRATEHDWQKLRQVRLAALADAPSAFGSTLEEEERFSESNWRAWARSSPVFLAWAQAEPVGVVAAVTRDRRLDRRLVALWVSPDHRGAGIASALVACVEDWARRDDAEQLSLWVALSSYAARSLYRRHGFEDSGERRSLPSNPAVEEEHLVLALRSDAGSHAPSSAPRTGHDASPSSGS